MLNYLCTCTSSTTRVKHQRRATRCTILLQAAIIQQRDLLEPYTSTAVVVHKEKRKRKHTAISSNAQLYIPLATVGHFDSYCGMPRTTVLDFHSSTGAAHPAEEVAGMLLLLKEAAHDVMFAAREDATAQERTYVVVA